MLLVDATRFINPSIVVHSVWLLLFFSPTSLRRTLRPLRCMSSRDVVTDASFSVKLFPPPCFEDHHLLVPSRPPRKLTGTVPRPVVHSFADTSETKHAATVVAACWKSFSVRRSVRSAKVLSEFRHAKALQVQCSFRRFVAVKCSSGNQKQRDGYTNNVKLQYAAHQLQSLQEMIRWRFNECDAAACVLQGAFRWWRDGHSLTTWTEDPMVQVRQQERCHQKKQKWRHLMTLWNDNGGLSPLIARSSRFIESRKKKDKPEEWLSLPCNSNLQGNVANNEIFGVLPLSKIVHANQRRRGRDDERALIVSSSAERRVARRVKLEGDVMEENAAIIQRKFRSVLSTQIASDRRVYSNYLHCAAATIQRTVRRYRACCVVEERRSRQNRDASRINKSYGPEQILKLNTDALWRAATTNAASSTIAACFRWYRLKKQVQKK